MVEILDTEERDDYYVQACVLCDDIIESDDSDLCEVCQLEACPACGFEYGDDSGDCADCRAIK